MVEGEGGLLGWGKSGGARVGCCVAAGEGVQDAHVYNKCVTLWEVSGSSVEVKVEVVQMQPRDSNIQKARLGDDDAQERNRSASEMGLRPEGAYRVTGSFPSSLQLSLVRKI